VKGPDERFDPEGWKWPEGEWVREFVTRAREIRADNGSRVMNSPGFGFETEPSGELVMERVRVIYCVESKGQTGSADSVMAAKLSLRTSERSFRVSSSGRMQVRGGAFAALTRRALKSIDGERLTPDPGHPAADRTSSMPTVRSIMP